MNETQLADRLNRAIQRQSPQHTEARRWSAERTVRDLHPTTGSKALMQQAGDGSTPRTISSLNTQDGGKKFCFGIPGFGWGQGELEGIV